MLMFDNGICIFTARKRSLRQGNIFHKHVSVILSSWRGVGMRGRVGACVECILVDILFLLSIFSIYLSLVHT